jgi:hypothetical protein
MPSAKLPPLISPTLRTFLPSVRSRAAIAPDGKRALVAKTGADKVALLEIDGTPVAYKGYDMITGVFPYNVQITADGKLGLVNNNGASDVADGQVDTVAGSWLIKPNSFHIEKRHELAGGQSGTPGNLEDGRSRPLSGSQSRLARGF